MSTTGDNVGEDDIAAWRVASRHERLPCFEDVCVARALESIGALAQVHRLWTNHSGRTIRSYRGHRQLLQV